MGPGRDLMVVNMNQFFQRSPVSLVWMLQNMSKYNLPPDYIRQEEEIINNMDVEKHKALAQKYIDPSKMIYLIVGDAETQLEPLKELGLGEPVLLN
jgi:zinc protease